MIVNNPAYSFSNNHTLSFECRVFSLSGRSIDACRFNTEYLRKLFYCSLFLLRRTRSWIFRYSTLLVDCCGERTGRCKWPRDYCMWVAMAFYIFFLKVFSSGAPGRFGAFLGALGRFRAPLGAASWAPLGVLGAPLGALGLLRAPHLGRPWALSGAPGRFGAPLGAFGRRWALNFGAPTSARKKAG